MWVVINVRENEEGKHWQRVQIASLDRMAGAHLPQKLTCDQSPDDLDPPLHKQALWPEVEGARGRGLIAKEAVSVLAWCPHPRALTSALQALFGASCLAPPPPPQPATSCDAT